MSVRLKFCNAFPSNTINHIIHVILSKQTRYKKYLIININSNQSLYNCRIKIVEIFILLRSRLLGKEEIYKENVSETHLVFFKSKLKFDVEFVEDFSLKANSRFSHARLSLRSPLSLAFLLVLYLDIIAVCVYTCVSARLVQCRERCVDIGVAKLSATPGKNTAVLSTQKYTYCSPARGLDKRESDKVSPVSRYVSFHVTRFAVRSFRRTSCPRLVRGNTEETPLSQLSFFLQSSPHRGSLPRVGCLFPKGENDAAAEHARGTLEDDASSAVARTTSGNSFCSLRRVNRDYSPTG